MRFNRRNVNLLSFLITSFIIIMICVITKVASLMAVKKSEESIIEKGNNNQVTIWEIKIPEIMINQKILDAKNDSNSLVHYKKSYIKNGTIIIFCNTKIDRTNKNTKVFYRVNEQIFQYYVVEKGSIKKQDLDKLLGEENRVYILNDNLDSYYFLKCDFIGEI